MSEIDELIGVLQEDAASVEAPPSVVAKNARSRKKVEGVAGLIAGGKTGDNPAKVIPTRSYGRCGRL